MQRIIKKKKKTERGPEKKSVYNSSQHLQKHFKKLTIAARLIERSNQRQVEWRLQKLLFLLNTIRIIM